jgi:hypothetical protein
MKRRLFATVSSVSSALLLLATASWTRSYWVYDEFAFGTFDHGQWAWTAYSASYPFTRWPPAAPKGASLTLLTCFGKLSFHENLHHSDAEGRGAARGQTWASDDNIIPSFSYLYAVTGDMSGNGWWTIRQVTMRHWALVALFALAPTAWLRSSRRKGQRAA